MRVADAKRALEGARTKAAEIGKPVSVAIVDVGGAMVLFERINDAPAYSADIAQAKASGSALTGRDSAQLATMQQDNPSVFAIVAHRLSGGPFAPARGAVPLLDPDGVVCGGIGVSGATAEEDEQIARAGARGDAPAAALKTVRACLYIMCGLPFAGKSTLARTLAVEKAATIVELDAVNTELGIGFGVGRITADEWARSYAECYSRLSQLLVSGHSAIFDATNFTFGQRERVRGLASAVGAEAVVVYVSITSDEARRRLEANRREPRRSDLRDDDFEQVLSGFEPPQEGEATLIV